MNADRLPDLSVILPTDSYESIQLVLEKLRRQTIADRIELIVVATSSDAVAEVSRHEKDFAALRIVEARSLSPLAVPRTAGIRAATSPLIFIGETHSYLHPDAAEKLVAVMSDKTWTAAVPGFENANPNSLWSWSAFLAAYGRWSCNLPAGEIAEAPMYDCIYRRDALLELGDALEEILKHGDGLRRAMEARGRRVYFEPGARIGHMNIERPRAWMHEHFLIGKFIGGRRAVSWPWWRRFVYAASAGLIPFLLFRRVWPGLRATIRARQVPAGTIAFVFLAYLAKAAGELVGYLGGDMSAAEEEMMNHYEVHRFDYVRNPARVTESLIALPRTHLP